MRSAPFLLIIFTSLYCQAQSVPEPSRSDCNYYVYLDSTHQCKQKGYLIKYGYKYCDLFLFKKRDRFSEEGYQWAQDMGYCLQTKLKEFSDSLSCKQIKKQAMRSHVNCLLDTDYLHLAKKDKRTYKLLVAHNPRNWIRGIGYLFKLNKAKHQLAVDSKR